VAEEDERMMAKWRRLHPEDMDHEKPFGRRGKR
jgi:hypothetical protein